MKQFRPFVLIFISTLAFAQKDTTILKRIEPDTAKLAMNMDAVYNRPFLQVGKTPVAVGGYLEANSQYQVVNGVTDGLSFQMRRMTLFLASSISRKIKFLSEIEFEDGTKEINIEFAAMDLELHPLFNIRGGIIMNPIGAFNQNHDGPKWEFIDRPISATQMLPATWSNVGFGLHGKYFKQQWVLAYEGYLTNGFDESIIGNDQNKTFLPATKLNRNRFEESSNGVPLVTTKLAIRHRKIGELGLSYMGGVYNKFQQDGLILDKRRRVDTWAIDFSTRLQTRTSIKGEFAFVYVDVPESYTQQYGSKQYGGFIDFVQPIITKPMSGFTNAVLNIALRVEYVDWNVGKFKENNDPIGDEVFAIVPGISFRPSAQTVLRANYRYSWRQDILKNPAERSAAFQIGFSTYF